MEDQVDLPVLQPSQAVNVTGSCNTHAMKRGQKLIGELYDAKNEMFMYAMLCEAACEGFTNTLCFPRGPHGYKPKFQSGLVVKASSEGIVLN
jgi:hypothetical protein